MEEAGVPLALALAGTLSVPKWLCVREADAGALTVAQLLGVRETVGVEHSLASGEGVAEAVVECEGGVVWEASALEV